MPVRENNDCINTVFQMWNNAYKYSLFILMYMSL